MAVSWGAQVHRHAHGGSRCAHSYSSSVPGFQGRQGKASPLPTQRRAPAPAAAANSNKGAPAPPGSPERQWWQRPQQQQQQQQQQTQQRRGLGQGGDDAAYAAQQDLQNRLLARRLQGARQSKSGGSRGAAAGLQGERGMEEPWVDPDAAFEIKAVYCMKIWRCGWGGFCRRRRSYGPPVSCLPERYLGCLQVYRDPRSLEGPGGGAAVPREVGGRVNKNKGRGESRREREVCRVWLARRRGAADSDAQQHCLLPGG